MDIEKLITKVRGWFIGHDQSESASTSQQPNEPETAADTTDFDETVSDILDDAGKFVSETFDKVSKKSEPLIKKSKAYIYDRIFDQYKKDGMPYGDTHEGLMRWVDEREMRVRSTVDDSLNKGKEVVSQTVKKVADYVEDRFDNSPSQATVDGSVKPDEPTEEQN
jgi:ElaB/YqjD/DUF883 family membrane-anchored ribosome-binding protein